LFADESHIGLPFLFFSVFLMLVISEGIAYALGVFAWFFKCLLGVLAVSFWRDDARGAGQGET
jgi:hypothetical protein